MPLQIRLLANPAVLRDGKTVPAFSSPRLQRLLAMLVLQPRESIPRSRMAFQLWPDSPEQQARTNLRKLVHELRKAIVDIDRYVEIDQQSLRWRDDSSSRVDLLVCREALDRHEDELAVQAYTGDLLPDCYDDWIIVERERLREAVGEALDRLMMVADHSGELNTVVTRAVARLKLDPCWEPACRHLMLAYAGLGNRAAAMQAYHKCAEQLDRELGVAPDPETLRVYDQVCGHADDAALHGAEGMESWPMVGRDAEIARIASIWEQASAGNAHLLLVCGEPGIGKTRLLDEFARGIRSSATVAWAQAYEAAGRLPWGAVVEWLRSGTIISSIERLESAWRETLSVVLPELRARPTDIGALRDPGIDPSFRRQLFDAVSRALLATDRPTLLVLDDLQWADPDTFQFLSFLLVSRPASPLLVAATLRDEEISRDHMLANIQTGLRAKGKLTQLQLTPLDADAVARLVFHLTGENIEPDEATEAWRDTAGIPLFLVESARAGLTGRAGSTPAPMTPTVKATIAARLDRLEPTALSVVELAATFGQAFDLDTLALAAKETIQEVNDAVDDLWRRRIMRERGDLYDFTHARIREVAYERVSPARRRQLHRAIADAMLEYRGVTAGGWSAAIAKHHEAAGRVMEAADAHGKAAEHAAAVFSFDEAIASCQRGLALFEQLSPGRERDARELDLRVALGPPAVARDGYGSAIARESYERAVVLCKRLGRQVDPAVLRGLGLAAVTACDFTRSTRFAKELLVLRSDAIARTEGHYLYGVSDFWRGRLASSERHLLAAISSYEPERAATHRKFFAQDPAAVCLMRLALTRLWCGDVGGARYFAMRAHSLAASLAHPLTFGYVLIYEAMAAIELHDVSWLRRAVVKSAVAVEDGASLIERIERVHSAWFDFIGARHGALEALEKAVAILRSERESLHLTHGLSLLARAYLRTGNLDGGLQSVAEAVDWVATHDQRYVEPLLRRVEGELLLLKGDRAAAVLAFTRSSDVAESQGATWFARRAARRLEAFRDS